MNDQSEAKVEKKAEQRVTVLDLQTNDPNVALTVEGLGLLAEGVCRNPEMADRVRKALLPVMGEMLVVELKKESEERA